MRVYFFIFFQHIKFEIEARSIIEKAILECLVLLRGAIRRAPGSKYRSANIDSIDYVYELDLANSKLTDTIIEAYSCELKLKVANRRVK